MKYITYMDGGAAVFSDRITHSSMLCGRTPLGAGFCGIRETETADGGRTLKVTVSGWSDSIGIGPSPRDEQILTNLIRGGFLPG